MGVVVNVRKGFYRVGLWTRTVGKSISGDKNGRTPAQGKEILENIGRRFKEVLRQVHRLNGHLHGYSYRLTIDKRNVSSALMR
jgi:hypothetical protein